MSPAERRQMMLAGPIVPTILTLAAPNVLNVAMQSLVSIADAWFVGQLGVLLDQLREPVAASPRLYPWVSAQVQVEDVLQLAIAPADAPFDRPMNGGLAFGLRGVQRHRRVAEVMR